VVLALGDDLSDKEKLASRILEVTLPAKTGEYDEALVRP
jgi:hypothetical protein